MTATDTTDAAVSERTVLTVEGMTCGSCVNTVTRALSRVPGVTHVDVDRSSGTAVVDGDARPEALVAAVEKAGYTASLTPEKELPGKAAVATMADAAADRAPDGRYHLRQCRGEDAMANSALAEQSCTPCRGGIPPLTREEAESYRAQAPGWALLDNATRLERTYRFRNFREAFAFVAKTAELAETEGHHPDIGFGWGYATASLRTKKIKGLHENDFIMAAKLDRLAQAGGTAPQED